MGNSSRSGLRRRVLAAIRAYPALKAAENQRLFPYQPTGPGIPPGKKSGNPRPTESAALKADADAQKIIGAVEEALRICSYLGASETDIHNIASALWWGEREHNIAYVSRALNFSESTVALRRNEFRGVLAALLDKNSG